jgi:hypothetical protein
MNDAAHTDAAVTPIAWTERLEEAMGFAIDASAQARDMLESLEAAGVFAIPTVDRVLRSLRALVEHISCAELCETEDDFFANARLAKAESDALCLAIFPAIEVVKARGKKNEAKLLEVLRDLRSESRYLDGDIEDMLREAV